MAARNTIHVALVNAGGQLVYRQADFAPGQMQGLESSTRSALQCVLLAVVRDAEGDAGGPFWTIYSGNEQYGLSENAEPEGCIVVQRDVTGPQNGARQRVWNSDATPPGAQETIPAALELLAMARGNWWEVVDGGSGAEYEALVAQAMSDLGVPV